ncbi:DegT/DnrJ/EryC1/StrS family aminotransferase [Methylobacter sp. Wu1]|uniref:DegT/DnrJ/EryC1/StrS family aminotransferase n=1 Tax=Methylobacter sp. Wu1 TaxID=3119359 RepID=UPI002F958E19
MLNIEPIGDCIPIRSARAAIVVALRALELPSDACIGVPLYCCPVVFKAIKAVGCNVRFIDVEPDTFCMSVADLEAKIAQIDAVVAVHMFGNVCDMQRIKVVAQGKPIIEDCAQSIGSAINGQMTGSFGDIAVFSFRSGKYLSVGEGGALYAKDDKILSSISQLVSELPVPGRMDDCMHVIKTYIRSILRSKPLWGLIGCRLWSAYNKSTAFAEKTPIAMTQMFRSDIAITSDRLAALNGLIEKQRGNADYFSESLALAFCKVPDEKTGAFYNRYLYPVMLSEAHDREAIVAYLLERKIGTIQPYKDIAEIAAAHYDYAGDCPMAEQVARRVLVFPCYHALKKEELQKIAQSVTQALQLTGPAAGSNELFMREAMDDPAQ